MSELINNATIAACKESNVFCDCARYGYGPCRDRKDEIRAAIAVILAALREPSEAMIDQCMEEFGGTTYPSAYNRQATKADWQRMLAQFEKDNA